MIAVIVADLFRRLGHADNPMVAILLEQAAGHRRARTDLRRIQQPTKSPVGLQPLARQKKVRRYSAGVVRRLAGEVTLQAGRSRGEHLARDILLLLCKRLGVLLEVWLLLSRKGHEKTAQSLQLVGREIERWHAHFQV